MRLLPMELRVPGVCLLCRGPVVFTGKRWQDTGRHVAHTCPEDRPLCGAWMPNARERCARRPGHYINDHRTRYALDNAAARHTRQYGASAA